MVSTYREFVGDGQCTARAASTGERCRRRAVDGLSVCRIHGGGTRSARAKSERVKVQAQLETTLATIAHTYGDEYGRDIDPITGLRKLIRLSYAKITWLQQQLQHMPDNQLFSRIETESVRALPGSAPGGAVSYDKITVRPEAAALVQQDLIERKHLAELLRLAAAIGLRERELALIQSEVALLERALTQAFQQCDVPPQLQAELRAAVAQHLTVNSDEQPQK